MPGSMTTLSLPEKLKPPWYTPGWRTYVLTPAPWLITWAVCRDCRGMVVGSGEARYRYGSGVGGTPVSIGPTNCWPCDPPAYPPVISKCSDCRIGPVPEAYMASELVEL